MEKRIIALPTVCYPFSLVVKNTVLNPDRVRDSERRLQLVNEHAERLQSWDGTAVQARSVIVRKKITAML